MALSSIECRARAEEKIAEAERHPRHHRRLICAAEAWLYLASQTKRLEAQIQLANDRANRKR